MALFEFTSVHSQDVNGSDIYRLREVATISQEKTFRLAGWQQRLQNSLSLQVPPSIESEAQAMALRDVVASTGCLNQEKCLGVTVS